MPRSARLCISSATPCSSSSQMPLSGRAHCAPESRWDWGRAVSLATPSSLQVASSGLRAAHHLCPGARADATDAAIRVLGTRGA